MGRCTRPDPTNVFFGVLLLLVAGCMVGACARLPDLVPAADMAPLQAAGLCRGPFPTQPWRAVHALHLSGPFGQRQSVMGVTVVDPHTQRIRAVVLSLEGFVLFDASRCGDPVSVLRALPPLDREGFPEGLLRDVSFLFLAPHGPPTHTGRDSAGDFVCRWRDEPEGTLDLVNTPDGGWRILQYDTRSRLRRTAEIPAAPEESLPENARLAYHGIIPYAMDLTLVDAEFLTGSIEYLFTETPSP